MKRLLPFVALTVLTACDGPTAPPESPRVGTVRVSVVPGIQEFSDPDGFLLTTAGGDSWVPGGGDSLVFDSLAAGDSFVAQLSDLAHDCWVADDERRVTVRPDTVVDLRFVVHCTTQWSYIRLVTKTSGLPGPATGHLMIRNGIESAIGTNDTVDLLGPAGAVEQVAIQGGSPGCWSSDTTTHAISYPTAGQRTTVTTEVACGVILLHTFPLGPTPKLYQVNVVTSEIRNLPWIFAEAYDFRLSPDGKRVVFTAPPPAPTPVQGPRFDLWTMAPDGTAITQVTQSPLDEILPVWDLDGQGLRFTDYLDGTIRHLDLSNATISTLAREGDFEWAVTPRPGTGELAYARSLGGWVAIWLMSPAGTDRHPAFSVNYFLTYPDWSPDGARLIATGGETNLMDRVRLYLGQPGSVPVPITDPGSEGSDRYPRWSPDGSRIAFVRLLSGENMRRLMLVDPQTGTTSEIPIPFYWTGVYTWLR